MLRSDGALDDTQRATIDAVVRSHGGRSRWRRSVRAARSYGLLELTDGQAEASAAAAVGGAIVYDSAVIALAVFPAVAEALPALLAALGGPGRPSGVLTCEPCDGGIVVEWDVRRSPAGVILGLIDVELRRFNSGRTAELLTPLPPEWIAKIGADGLQEPDMSLDRVLEELIERANLGRHA
jgi:hypothetical protein